MSDPLIGRRLANYRIERLIGRGGMASVYYGWDGKLQRPVAIKVADAGHQDIAYAKRLVREARMIARWRHDHVIQVYYADLQDSLYYFAMEFIDGVDLGALMARYTGAGELVPHSDVVRIGRAVAGALDYAHTQRVIHRDVKPSNVLLALDGRIVLSDFGLALDVQQGTLGEVLGTPHYVAPEQARDSASTVPASDFYSLGVILYELLTGSVPFDDPSPMSLALKHMTEPPPLPTQINPALSIPVEAVLLKALSKAPEDRYPSGEVLLDALERALAGAFGEPFGLPPAMMIGGADKLLITPVADLLARIGSSRSTLPAHPESSDQPVTAPVRLARDKVARKRTRLWLLLGGLAAIVIVLIAAAALLSGLTGGGAILPAGAVIATLPQAIPSSEPTGEASPAPETAALATASGAGTPEAQAPIITEQPPTSEPPASPPQPGIASTVLYPDGYSVTLFSTERGFYLFNPGNKKVVVGHLAFEAISAVGAPAAYRFDTKEWTAHFAVVEKGKCDGIEIRLTFASDLRPKACKDFNALITPENLSPELFWLLRDNAGPLFRVLWDAQEIARCPLGSGTCEVNLPPQ